MVEEIKDAVSLSLLSPCLQEASASFAEWEKLMKGMGSAVVATDNPFTQVMSLVTQMYKQTAIAKVMGDQGEYIFFIIHWIRLLLF